MAVTTNQTSLNMSDLSTPQPGLNHVQNHNHRVILAVNCVVLIIGFIGLSQMWQIIYNISSQKGSATILAVLNLIFAHFIYLLTVPFRIYYFATHRWGLTVALCKIVSSMIFIHMYMSFIFYVIIVVTRLQAFRKAPVAFGQSCHTAIACVLVWLIVLIAVPCVLYFKYATHHHDNSNCFHFGYVINKEMGAKVFNYVTSLLIIGATLVLVALQTVVQVKVWKNVRDDWRNDQEFWRQAKSSLFVLIMVVCFLPYAMFRLYYIECVNHEEHGAQLEKINEVFLSLTTLNCVDMFTFVRVMRVRWSTCCD